MVHDVPLAPPEKTTKYLGLVIEKDAEYEEEGDEDYTSRKYVPIRDKYIVIVRHCLRLVIDSYNRKSRQELKRTYRSLRKVGAKIQHQNSKKQKLDE